MKLPCPTIRALDAIETLVAAFERETGDHSLIPVVCWMAGSSEPGFVPGPCIAADVPGRYPAEFVVERRGIRLAYNLPEETYAQYSDHLLDFLGGRFIFVTANVAAFLD